MKKTIFFLVLLPILVLGQTYTMAPVTLSLSDLTSSTAGGASGSVSITNNVLSVYFGGGWLSAPMKYGIIKNLNITPPISFLDLGPIQNNPPSYPTGYYAKIDNNNLVFYVLTYPATLSGCSLNFSKNLLPNKILFTYDSEGNQTQRVFCINCLTQKTRDTTKEDNTIIEDNITYYPNPVKEELHLDWQLANDTTVTEIHIFDIKGQLIRTFATIKTINNYTINFQEYPSGIYLVALKYSNSEQKFIKIIKQ